MKLKTKLIKQAVKIKKAFNNHLQMLKKQDQQAGTTFIEVLVTIAIIAILMSTITIAVVSNISKAQDAAVKTDMASLRTALEMYVTDNYRYPASLDEVAPYMKNIKVPIVDKFGEPYVYIVDETAENFTLYSKGKDKQDDGGDPVKDIIIQ